MNNTVQSRSWGRSLRKSIGRLLYRGITDNDNNVETRVQPMQIPTKLAPVSTPRFSGSVFAAITGINVPPSPHSQSIVDIEVESDNPIMDIFNLDQDVDDGQQQQLLADDDNDLVTSAKSSKQDFDTEDACMFLTEVGHDATIDNIPPDKLEQYMAKVMEQMTNTSLGYSNDIEDINKLTKCCHLALVTSTKRAQSPELVVQALKFIKQRACNLPPQQKSCFSDDAVRAIINALEAWALPDTSAEEKNAYKQDVYSEGGGDDIQPRIPSAAVAIAGIEAMEPFVTDDLIAFQVPRMITIILDLYQQHQTVHVARAVVKFYSQILACFTKSCANNGKEDEEIDDSKSVYEFERIGETSTSYITRNFGLGECIVDIITGPHKADSVVRSDTLKILNAISALQSRDKYLIELKVSIPWLLNVLRSSMDAGACNSACSTIEKLAHHPPIASYFLFEGYRVDIALLELLNQTLQSNQGPQFQSIKSCVTAIKSLVEHTTMVELKMSFVDNVTVLCQAATACENSPEIVPCVLAILRNLILSLPEQQRSVMANNTSVIDVVKNAINSCVSRKAFTLTTASLALELLMIMQITIDGKNLTNEQMARFAEKFPNLREHVGDLALHAFENHDSMCVICQADSVTDFVWFICGHRFCAKCMANYLECESGNNTKCPICRAVHQRVVFKIGNKGGKGSIWGSGKSKT